MNLHRSDKIPDWEKENQGPQPKYVEVSQIVARKTKGIVTPANVVSTIGLGLNISGAKDIVNGKNLKGTVKTIVGKGCDFVDGWLAEKTKTKSAIGEAVDALFDKVGTVATLFALSKQNIVPRQRAMMFGSQNSINVFSSVLAKQNQVELHSSKHGKVTFALQGISMGASLVGSNFDSETQPLISKTIEKVADSTALVANVLGGLVSLDYLETAMPHEDKPQYPNDSLEFSY